MISIKRQTLPFKAMSVGQLRALLPRVRNLILHHIRDYTRTRVRTLGLGAGRSALKGYSEQPLVVDYPGNPKAITRPTGGTKTHGGMFFPGGYKEYREKAGLAADRFILDNRGDLWNDWRVLLYGDISHIGFSNADNAMAAVAATENDRPLLFSIDNVELSMVNAQVIGIINKAFVS